MTTPMVPVLSKPLKRGEYVKGFLLSRATPQNPHRLSGKKRRKRNDDDDDEAKKDTSRDNDDSRDAKLIFLISVVNYAINAL